jgi:hypothetical protein
MIATLNSKTTAISAMDSFMACSVKSVVFFAAESHIR